MTGSLCMRRPSNGMQRTDTLERSVTAKLAQNARSRDYSTGSVKTPANGAGVREEVAAGADAVEEGGLRAVPRPVRRRAGGGDRAAVGLSARGAAGARGAGPPWHRSARPRGTRGRGMAAPMAPSARPRLSM